jgi:hypothetical protein
MNDLLDAIYHIRDLARPRRLRCMFKAVLVAIFAAAAGAEPGSTRLRSGVATPLSAEELPTTGEIYFAGVRAPLGAFVLARQGRLRCALRIDRFWEEGDGHKRLASYTSFYRNDAKDNLLAAGYRTTSGVLSRLPPIGPGRLAIQRGDRSADCGKLKLHWSDPNWIEFYGVKGLQLAITQISDPERVHFDAPELRWVAEDSSSTRAPEVFERATLCCDSVR